MLPFQELPSFGTCARLAGRRDVACGKGVVGPAGGVVIGPRPGAGPDRGSWRKS